MKSALESLPEYSKEEAHFKLSVHGFTCKDVDSEEMRKGFLGSLRPYRGKLNHDAFIEVMACLKVLGPLISSETHVKRSTLSNLWGICYLARDWATHPDGMLRRNKLILEADVEIITQWINCISYATMMFLDGQEPAAAFTKFEDYVEKNRNAE